MQNRRVHTRERVVAMTVRVTTLKGLDAGLYYVEGLPSYYLDAGSPAGVWQGTGAVFLGLVGEVRDQDFLDLMAGLEPGYPEPLGRHYGSRNGTPMTMSNMRRAFQLLCRSAGFGSDWTTYELRHSFVSLVADQLDDLVKVADLAGHVDTRTTEGYRHAVRPSIPHAIEAWELLFAKGQE